MLGKFKNNCLFSPNMRKITFRCDPVQQEQRDETVVYEQNKRKFLDLVRCQVGKGDSYFYSSLEGTTEVAAEIAPELGAAMVKLSNIVAAARTGYSGEDEDAVVLEADQLNPSALEAFLNRYEGKNLVIKDNYPISQRKDYIDLVAATLSRTLDHYEQKDGQVFIFGKEEPKQLEEAFVTNRPNLTLVKFCPYVSPD